jgi:hypothetical protein
VDGGTGADAFTADAVDSFTIDGKGGTDSLTLSTNGTVNDFTKLTSIEKLNLANGANTVDLTSASAGLASVIGGSADDSLYAFGATAGFYLSGGSGGNDTFVGSASNDTIFGNSGADSILAGDGADRIVFTTAAALDAAATVAGGNGNDTIAITTPRETVLDTNFQTDVVTVEALEFAGNGNNSAVFSTHANAAGIQSLFGGTGNDSLLVDTSTYVVAAPTYVGSSGTDTLSLFNSGATLGDTFFANMSSIETFITANGSNDITFGATAGIQTIIGGTGADDLDASAINSAVTLFGGTGADTITGGSGGSRQQGWGGTSTLNTSNDTLTGGAGTDVFVLGDSTGNAYGLDSNPGSNFRALISGFDITKDQFVLWDRDQTGSVSVAADSQVANRMNISVGGLRVYEFVYNPGLTGVATIYVAGTTNVVAEMSGFTGSGSSLSTNNFNLV